MIRQSLRGIGLIALAVVVLLLLIFDRLWIPGRSFLFWEPVVHALHSDSIYPESDDSDESDESDDVFPASFA